MRLIDADELKKELHNFFDGKVIDEPTYILRDVFCHIDNAPTINTDEIYKKGFKDGWNRLWIEMKKLDCDEKEGKNTRPQGEWIPITMRPIEEDEKIDFPYVTFIFTCPMPENGEEILITTKYGVEFDTCYNADGYYLDSDKDWDEVFAWMPLPEPYKKGGAEE